MTATMRTTLVPQPLPFALVPRMAFALPRSLPVVPPSSHSMELPTRRELRTTKGHPATTSSPCPLTTRPLPVLRISVLCSTLSAVAPARRRLRLLHRSVRSISNTSGPFPLPLAKSSSSLRLQRRLPATSPARRSRTHPVRTICRILSSLEQQPFRPTILKKHRGQLIYRYHTLPPFSLCYSFGLPLDMCQHHRPRRSFTPFARSLVQPTFPISQNLSRTQTIPPHTNPYIAISKSKMKLKQLYHSRLHILLFSHFALTIIILL